MRQNVCRSVCQCVASRDPCLVTRVHTNHGRFPTLRMVVNSFYRDEDLDILALGLDLVTLPPHLVKFKP